MLTYYYDLALPAKLAAPIQILKTAAALARRGVPIRTVWRSVGKPVEDVLQFYGVEPVEGLELLEAGGPAQAAGELAEARVVMSRGEPGVQLLRHLPPGRPFIYEAHRLCKPGGPLRLLPWRKWRLAALERRAVAEAAGLVCISRGILEELQARCEVRGPTLVLPSGTDGPLEADGPRDIDIVYAGKLEARKGLAVAVAAVGRLPGVGMTIVGGNDRQIAQLRAAAGPAAARLTFTGFVPPAEVRRLVARARVGVCPLPAGVNAVSERFTSPMKLLELFACGTPAVASDVPSVRELLANAEDQDPPALLVPPNDAAALAEAVRRVLADAALAARLAAAGRRYVGRFVWEERARRLEAFLEEACGEAFRP